MEEWNAPGCRSAPTGCPALGEHVGLNEVFIKLVWSGKVVWGSGGRDGVFALRRIAFAIVFCFFGKCNAANAAHRDGMNVEMEWMRRRRRVSSIAERVWSDLRVCEKGYDWSLNEMSDKMREGSEWVTGDCDLCVCLHWGVILGTAQRLNHVLAWLWWRRQCRVHWEG